MKYRLFWTDATLAENYQNEQDFINTMKRDGVEVEITANDGGWYDYEATHNFEADSDKKALEHIKDIKKEKYDNRRNNGRYARGLTCTKSRIRKKH